MDRADRTASRTLPRRIAMSRQSQINLLAAFLTFIVIAFPFGIFLAITKDQPLWLLLSAIALILVSAG